MSKPKTKKPIMNLVPPRLRKFLEGLEDYDLEEEERERLAAALALRGAALAQASGAHREAKDYLALITPRRTGSGVTNQILVAGSGAAQPLRPSIPSALPPALPGELQKLALSSLPDETQPEPLPSTEAEVIEEDDV
jgi:hypothetical protein